MTKRRILVTGGHGMVGSALRRTLKNEVAFFPTRVEVDFTDKEATRSAFVRYKPTHVIHLAAKVGGLKDNMDNQSEFFSQNVEMALNVLGTAADYGCEKVVSLLSSCIFPDQIEYPIEASKLHDGPPHESNFGYAYAKRMVDVYGRTLNQRLGRTAFVTLVPNNLYGKNDNFNLETGHFIPALIRKFSEHKILGKPIVMWGTGNPEREFTFADDIARIIMKALKFYNSEEPLNIGNPKNYRIREVVEMMASIAEVDASLIQWDLMMPDGQMKKPTKVDLKEIGWHNNDFTSLEDGLRETWLWFLKETSSRIRGIE